MHAFSLSDQTFEHRMQILSKIIDTQDHTDG